MELGGCYIDTAPLYGFGEVENLLGEVLKSYPRESYYMISKCGYVNVEGKTFQTVQKSGKYEDVIIECDKSLKRLGLDYIDLYFVHSPNKFTPFSETMQALTKLQKDGKIKKIGISNVNLDELQEYSEYGEISHIQNRFSLINRSIDMPFENYLKRKNIKLIPYHLLEIGLLTGIALDDFSLRHGDLRGSLSYWDAKNQHVIFKWVKNSLAPIAKELKISIAQLCIAWGLHHHLIDFVIVGTTKEEYLKINMEANSITLSPQTLAQLEKAYNDLDFEIKSKFNMEIKEFRGLNSKFY